MDFNWLTPKAQVINTSGKGQGSFATQKINKGEVIASFGGFVVEKKDLNKYSPDRVARSLQLNENTYLLSGSIPEPGDMVNHSCEPNCGALGTSSIRALKDIQVGEELSFDYAMTDASEYDEFECFCNKKSCRKKIKGTDWQISQLQEVYKGFFSSFIKKLIELSHSK